MYALWHSESADATDLLALPQTKPEPRHLGLEVIERDLQRLVAVAATEIAASRLGRPEPELSASSLFLADLPLLDSRLRSILLDPDLCPGHEARLQRAWKTYRQLRAVRTLRQQVEQALLCASTPPLVRGYLRRAAEAVAWLGKKAALATREPASHRRAAFSQIEATASAAVAEARQALRGTDPGHDALQALETARTAFTRVLAAHVL